LAEDFLVSDETVCRVVRQLAEIKLVRKVHRGVTTLHETMKSLFQKSMAEHHEEKHQIAEICSELFPDGTTLMLDCRTTKSYVARSLARHKDLTLITNSTDIA